MAFQFFHLNSWSVEYFLSSQMGQTAYFSAWCNLRNLYSVYRCSEAISCQALKTFSLCIWSILLGQRLKRNLMQVSRAISLLRFLFFGILDSKFWLLCSSEFWSYTFAAQRGHCYLFSLYYLLSLESTSWQKVREIVWLTLYVSVFSGNRSPAWSVIQNLKCCFIYICNILFYTYLFLYMLSSFWQLVLPSATYSIMARNRCLCHCNL